jgi:tetratricopeptide (TPR) repeat protein
MRKFLVLIVAISISIGAKAQMGKVTSALALIESQSLDKAKEALDQALINEKSMTNPKTFLAKGKLCQEVFKSENPKFKALYPNPLDEAYAAYQKALELDPKGNIKKQLSLNQTYLILGNDYITQGAQMFEAQDFAGALKSFERNIEIASSDIYVGLIDSGVFFNAGLSAYNAKLYDKAVPYFVKCTEMKYEGPTPFFLEYQAYMAITDTANAGSTLQRAFKNYPDNQDVLLNLVDFYMKNNKLEDAFSYINLAKSKDPNNYSLHWAESILFMRQEKYDAAIACLNKSIELKGDVYETQFNQGVCYYNKAVELIKEADVIMDAKKYSEAVAAANAVFIQAIPYFEKASVIKKDDVEALRNLKELYFRLRTLKPEYEAKYNEVLKRIEGK